MNSLLLWIGGVLVAVLGLLFAAPYVVDWNAYRGVFEEEATRILGRDVRVGGKVNLRLLPSPYVRFEKVRISDAGAALGEPFFRAESFTLWLSPTPLLRGAIEAHQIELDRPVLRLAVDEEGRGNWQSLTITPGALPFMPNDVVLQQLRIRDGIVSLRTPNAVEPFTLTGIEGEIAAQSLEGPYRFRGNVNWAGAMRELRIGTSQREPDGRLRYKASVRALDSGNLYAVDGTLSEISAKARHTGVLTARLPLANLLAGVQGRSSRSEAVDLKANVEGDIDSVRASDVSFEFEQGGKPQLLTGDTIANWRNGLRMETRLASRWLDLDLIAGADGIKTAPADIVRRLIGHVSALLPADGTSLLTVDVEQINLGGEALGNVRLALARAGGLTSIGELKATLPGNAKGELRGRLGAATAGGTAPAATGEDAGSSIRDGFDGELVVHGGSYRRFLGWAGGAGLLETAEAASGRADAGFSIVSRLRLLPERLTLSDASIELGTRAVGGSADWKWGRERQLDIDLKGRNVDVSGFVPGGFDLTAAATATPGSAVPGPNTGSVLLTSLGARAAAIERAVGGLRLKVVAQTLSDGTTILHDVDGDVTLRGDRLEIVGLKFSSPTTARLDIRGELTAISSQPQGSLRGWIGADSNQGIAAIASILPDSARAHAGALLHDAGKADLGFVLGLAGGASRHASVALNGVLDDARLAFDLKLDGGLVQWRDAPIDLTVTVDGAAAGDLVRRVSGYASVGGRRRIGETVVRIKATGASAGALISHASLETKGIAGATRVTFSGQSSIDGSGQIVVGGDVGVDAADAGDLLLLAGAARLPDVAGNAVRGTLGFDRKSGVTRFTTRDLQVGNSRVAGSLSVTTKADRTRIDGRLSADRIALMRLIGLVLDGEKAPVTVGAGSDDAGSPWPDTALSLALLERVEGQITMASPLIGLTDGLELTDGEIALGLSPGRLSVTSLTGAALGGRFTGRGTIEAAAGGADLSIEARLTGAKLAQLGSGREAAAVQRNLGEANLTLNLKGRASSPRAAMSQLLGKGEIEIRNGRVEGLWAGLVEKAAVALIEGPQENVRPTLLSLLATERTRSALLLGNRKLSVDIADGVAKVGVLEIAAPEANVRNTTTVDLASLKVESDWRIVPRRPLPGKAGAGSRREPLPGIAIVWTGPLAGIARGEPRLSLDALEREIAIRKIEHDADQLEQLRRDDERRGAIETDRTRQGDDPGRGAATGTDTAAPAIPAPAASSPGSEPAGNLPNIIRPPGSRPSPPPAPAKREGRTLQDAVMGNQ